jgi:hypothetical protein
MVGMMAACSLVSLVILFVGNATVNNAARNRDVEGEVSVLL